jgi:HEPN domain-containing protein
MASVLLRAGFADGAVFHAYHAYECVLSAFIAVKGYPVPPEGWTTLRLPSGKSIKAYQSTAAPIQDRSAHKARLIFFDQLADQTKSYYKIFVQLSRIITVSDRQGTLYYDATVDRLPHEQYNASFAQELLPAVDQFIQDVRPEIR